MRFLCFHGMGTNSKIFEIQTAAIRHGLGSGHEFEYIDGALPAPMAQGVGLISSPDDEYLQYGDDTIPSSYSKALQDLDKFVQDEGPFDGIMAFSQGAGLAAALMIRKMKQDPHRERARPIFRCAIFFCGGIPWDPLRSDGEERRYLSFEEDGEVINVPSAHIWGANDQLYPTFGPVLSKLCSSDQRADYIHRGGHEIPGPKDPEGVQNAIRIIKRVIQVTNEEM